MFKNEPIGQIGNIIPMCTMAIRNAKYFKIIINANKIIRHIVNTIIRISFFRINRNPEFIHSFLTIEYILNYFLISCRFRICILNKFFIIKRLFFCRFFSIVHYLRCYVDFFYFRRFWNRVLLVIRIGENFNTHIAVVLWPLFDVVIDFLRWLYIVFVFPLGDLFLVFSNKIYLFIYFFFFKWKV